jgi:hypothetical protein
MFMRIHQKLGDKLPVMIDDAEDWDMQESSQHDYTLLTLDMDR